MGVIGCWIPSYSQRISDSCLTAKEIDFFLIQSVNLAECQQSLNKRDSINHYSDSTINALSVAIHSKNEQIADAHHQTAIEKANYDNCKTDSEYDKKTIQSLTKENKTTKILSKIITPIALAEALYIGIREFLLR